MKVDVRCCCDPGALLGTITVSGIGKFEQGLLKVRLRMEEGSMPGYLGVEVAQYYSCGTYHTAVKSNDLPMEVWRRVEGFEEASVHQRLLDRQARADRIDQHVLRQVRHFMEGDVPVKIPRAETMIVYDEIGEFTQEQFDKLAVKK